MHKGAVVPAIVLISVVIGGLFYLYGGAAFHPSFESITQQPSTQPNSRFSILAQGQNADAVDQRVNYRITNADQLEALWYLVYTTAGPPVPKIDFSKKEVLAVFSGSHSTGGYEVAVKDVREAGGKRVISIVYGEPADSCAVSSAQTSPFMLVVVDKSPLPVDHEETTQTSPCK
jgi:hypothetical protein